MSNIIYKEIDISFLPTLATKFGDVVNNHFHFGDGCYSLVAFDSDEAVGIISTYPENFPNPLNQCKDAYINILEVDKLYQRQGIARKMITMTEKWAKEYGYSQIRAWSSDDKIEAIPMWYALNYCMCPAKIWVEWCKEVVNGFYVAKKLH